MAKLNMDAPRYRGRICDDRTMTWAYPDGSGKITNAQKLQQELFTAKWKMNHEQGKVNISEMLLDAEKL